MNGGAITGNSTASSGGGVYVNSGTFTMTGGEISGNATTYGGGGVFVEGGGSFIKSGGIIYGADASPSSLKNTASGTGHAVYVDPSDKKRNNTAGAAVNLNSDEDGGWEQTVPISVTKLQDWNLVAQTRQVGRNTFTVFSVNGTYTAYQWYLDGTAAGTNADYTFAAGESVGNVYELTVVVTDNTGEQRSGRCLITIAKYGIVGGLESSVVVNLAPLEEWDLIPQSQSAAKNTVTPFSVTGAYTAYEWFLDGSPTSTAASCVFDSSGTKAGDTYELSVIVTDGAGEQRSGRCRITITN
jgi:hypothetical protein